MEWENGSLKAGRSDYIAFLRTRRDSSTADRQGSRGNTALLMLRKRGMKR